MAESSPGFNCTICSSISAEGFCRECKQLYCMNCLEFHRNCTVTKEHKTVIFESEDTKCDTCLKTGSRVTGFCVVCWQVYCEACTQRHVFLDVTSGHKLHLIENQLNKLEISLAESVILSSDFEGFLELENKGTSKTTSTTDQTYDVEKQDTGISKETVAIRFMPSNDQKYNKNKQQVITQERDELVKQSEDRNTEGAAIEVLESSNEHNREKQQNQIEEGKRSVDRKNEGAAVKVLDLPNKQKYNREKQQSQNKKGEQNVDRNREKAVIEVLESSNEQEHNRDDNQTRNERDLTTTGACYNEEVEKISATILDICFTIEGSDEHECSLSGITCLGDGRLVVLDFTNSKLKLLDQYMNIISFVRIKPNCTGLTKVSGNEIAVICGKCIFFCMVIGEKFSWQEKVFFIDNDGYKIAFNGTIFAITCEVESDEAYIQILSKSGEYLHRIDKFVSHPGPIINLDSQDNSIYISSHYKLGTVSCLSVDGEFKWRALYFDRDVVECKDYLLATCENYHAVFVATKDGSYRRIILQDKDHLRNPRYLAYNPETQELYVTLYDQEIIVKVKLRFR